MSKEEPMNNLRSEISKQLETIESYQKSYAALSSKYTELSEKYSPQSISVKFTFLLNYYLPMIIILYLSKTNIGRFEKSSIKM